MTDFLNDFFHKSAYYYDFWRSCDTEDWSNDAKNTAASHRNKLQFNMYSKKTVILNLQYCGLV